MSRPLVFLKLGGSLITDKARNAVVREDRLTQIAGELKCVLSGDVAPALIIGHGSGSFGHIPAKTYGTRSGVHTEREWMGFVEVWRQARRLNVWVLKSLAEAGIPAFAIPPSAAVLTENGHIKTWDLRPIKAALEANLVPVVYGDVTFDSERGGTIVSTEDVFAHLARRLQPQRILIAGIEDGVWADYPARTQLIDLLTPENVDDHTTAIRGSKHTDVTGGMDSKVNQMLKLAAAIPGLEIIIFNGSKPGAITDALAGKATGTRIRA